VPIETRGAIARYDEARDVLELYGAAKVPHWNRDTIARMLKRTPESVQLYEGHVGGGFGIRGELYPEDLLVCAAALKFRRPIKWIEDRREHLTAANHSRDQSHHIRAAIDAQGRILGIEDEFFHDNGALHANARGDRSRPCRRDAALVLIGCRRIVRSGTFA
jgi:CO/xanthine dehydrogenase Mo-binding subunit